MRSLYLAASAAALSAAVFPESCLVNAAIWSCNAFREELLPAFAAANAAAA
jgi:hypothetical protein